MAAGIACVLLLWAISAGDLGRFGGQGQRTLNRAPPSCRRFIVRRTTGGVSNGRAVGSRHGSRPRPAGQRGWTPSSRTSGLRSRALQARSPPGRPRPSACRTWKTASRGLVEQVTSLTGRGAQLQTQLAEQAQAHDQKIAALTWCSRGGSRKISRTLRLTRCAPITAHFSSLRERDVREAQDWRSTRELKPAKGAAARGAELAPHGRRSKPTGSRSRRWRKLGRNPTAPCRQN